MSHLRLGRAHYEEPERGNSTRGVEGVGRGLASMIRLLNYPARLSSLPPPLTLAQERPALDLTLR